MFFWCISGARGLDFSHDWNANFEGMLVGGLDSWHGGFYCNCKSTANRNPVSGTHIIHTPLSQVGISAYCNYKSTVDRNSVSDPNDTHAPYVVMLVYWLIAITKLRFQGGTHTRAITASWRRWLTRTANMARDRWPIKNANVLVALVRLPFSVRAIVGSQQWTRGHPRITVCDSSVYIPYPRW